MNDRRADHCPVARLQSAFAPILIDPMTQMIALIVRFHQVAELAERAPLPTQVDADRTGCCA